MSLNSSSLNKMLIAAAAMGVVAFSAAPASADYFDLSYSGGGLSGNIAFYGVSLGGGEYQITTLGEGTTSSGAVAAIEAPNTVINPTYNGNDNTLISKTGAPHFDNSGFAFVTSTGTVVDLYGLGRGGDRVIAGAYNSGQNGGGGITDLSAGTTSIAAISVQDLGAPGPVPGNGLSALAMLAGLALIAKLRGFVAQ